MVKRCFFPPPPLPTLSMCNCVSVCDSQTVHRCAVEGILRHLLDAIAGEPSVGRKRSQNRKHQAVTSTVNPFSFDSKEAFFHFFVLLARRSEPFTLQRSDLKGSRRRVKPQRQEELRGFFAGEQFHRRDGSCYLWKHTCVGNKEVNKI